MEEQLAIARTTDVLIGVHGNGLTHQLFMRPHGFVCEIFPHWKKGHHFDYQYLAKMMGHEYLAVSDGNGVTATRWGLRHNGTGWGPGTSLEPLFGMSSTSDLSNSALDSIASLVFHAMEQLLKTPT